MVLHQLALRNCDIGQDVCFLALSYGSIVKVIYIKYEKKARPYARLVTIIMIIPVY
jgi:hypothetical protein